MQMRRIGGVNMTRCTRSGNLATAFSNGCFSARLSAIRGPPCVVRMDWCAVNVPGGRLILTPSSRGELRNCRHSSVVLRQKGGSAWDCANVQTNSSFDFQSLSKSFAVFPNDFRMDCTPRYSPVCARQYFRALMNEYRLPLRLRCFVSLHNVWMDFWSLVCAIPNWESLDDDRER